MNSPLKKEKVAAAAAAATLALTPPSPTTIGGVRGVKSAKDAAKRHPGPGRKMFDLCCVSPVHSTSQS